MKLLAEKTPAETQRLQELAKKREKDEEPLSSSEAEELRAMCSVEQDVILTVMPEGAGDDEYDADKLRSERLAKLSAAEDGGSREHEVLARRKNSISNVVKLITLRFFANKDHSGKEGKEMSLPEINLPFLATWAQVCETLRKRFERIVHFTYINDKNVWLEVRSNAAFDAFRTQMGHEGLEKGTSVIVAQVRLLPFGSGAPPVVEALRDAFLLSPHYTVLFKYPSFPCPSLASNAPLLALPTFLPDDKAASQFVSACVCVLT